MPYNYFLQLLILPFIFIKTVKLLIVYIGTCIWLVEPSLFMNGRKSYNFNLNEHCILSRASGNVKSPVFGVFIE